jgi:Primase X
MTPNRTGITTTIEEGLDFILDHFQGPIWPRNVSTKTTEGRQVPVSSKTEALARFARSRNMDCRISAYPPNAENPSPTERFMGIRTRTPEHLVVMIDLDRWNFKTERGFEIAFTRILANIKHKLDAVPTILWSGRGYHVIVPMDSNGIVLENIKEFVYTPNISLKFLRFAEQYLSLKKSDPQHNSTVSFNNCMLRIPGSVNSKNGETVSIIQKWDQSRPEINYLLAPFTRYIINEKYNEILKAQKRKSSTFTNNNKNRNRIIWIEQLLQTPLSDYRKYCIWRILIPYLLNIRKLSELDATSIMAEWLNQCDQVRRLDFNYNQKIREAIEGAAKGFLPISREKLKEENTGLYYLL